MFRASSKPRSSAHYPSNHAGGTDRRDGNWQAPGENVIPGILPKQGRTSGEQPTPPPFMSTTELDQNRVSQKVGENRREYQAQGFRPPSVSQRARNTQSPSNRGPPNYANVTPPPTATQAWQNSAPVQRENRPSVPNYKVNGPTVDEKLKSLMNAASIPNHTTRHGVHNAGYVPEDDVLVPPPPQSSDSSFGEAPADKTHADAQYGYEPSKPSDKSRNPSTMEQRSPHIPPKYQPPPQYGRPGSSLGGRQVSPQRAEPQVPGSDLRDAWNKMYNGQAYSPGPRRAAGHNPTSPKSPPKYPHHQARPQIPRTSPMGQSSSSPSQSSSQIANSSTEKLENRLSSESYEMQQFNRYSQPPNSNVHVDRSRQSYSDSKKLDSNNSGGLNSQNRPSGPLSNSRPGSGRTVSSSHYSDRPPSQTAKMYNHSPRGQPSGQPSSHTFDQRPRTPSGEYIMHQNGPPVNHQNNIDKRQYTGVFGNSGTKPSDANRPKTPTHATSLGNASIVSHPVNQINHQRQQYPTNNNLKNHPTTISADNFSKSQFKTFQQHPDFKSQSSLGFYQPSSQLSMPPQLELQRTKPPPQTPHDVGNRGSGVGTLATKTLTPDGWGGNFNDIESVTSRSVTPPLPPLSPNDTPPETPTGSPLLVRVKTTDIGEERRPDVVPASGKKKHTRPGMRFPKSRRSSPGKYYRSGYSRSTPLRGSRADSVETLSESLDDDYMDIDSAANTSNTEMDTTVNASELRGVQDQLEGLESMFGEILKVLGLDKEYLPGSRRSISSTSSFTGSRRHSHHRRGAAFNARREIQRVNKRFQRLESHVVTLARSVAHLSSEMRSQNVVMREIEDIKEEIRDLKLQPAAARPPMPAPAQMSPLRHGKIGPLSEFEKFRCWVPLLTNPRKVDKLRRFFGEEPPLLHIFLKRLGYERYHVNFQNEKITMTELPYLNEDRLEKIGIPLGPRLRILQESQMCFRQENFDIYIV